MQCMSCESEINPKWKHAISENICPFCGENIMAAQLKELLCLISNKIEHVQEIGFSSQFDDWLLSNYGYIKIDSPKLIDYIDPALLHIMSVPKENQSVKVKTDKGEEEVVVEKIQASEMTNDFFKRAEAIKPGIDGFESAAKKTEHLKKMAEQIRKAGSSALTEAMDGEVITADMLKNADPEAIAEWQSLLSNSGEISSSLPENNDDEEIPAIVMSMANQTNNSGNSGNSKNAKDLLKLQQMQDRINKSRSNFKNGGGGSFSRS